MSAASLVNGGLQQAVADQMPARIGDPHAPRPHANAVAIGFARQPFVLEDFADDPGGEGAHRPRLAFRQRAACWPSRAK